MLLSSLRHLARNPNAVARSVYAFLVFAMLLASGPRWEHHAHARSHDSDLSALHDHTHALADQHLDVKHPSEWVSHDHHIPSIGDEDQNSEFHLHYFAPLTASSGPIATLYIAALPKCRLPHIVDASQLVRTPVCPPYRPPIG